MATTSRSSKCRCCPYGFHIDLDFVTYAEDANKGQQLKRTPITGKKQIGERTLMSPLDSIFSDSLENILSDFDDALAERQPQVDLTAKRFNAECGRRRLQNGYLSDYTGYNSNSGSEVRNVNVNGRSRPFALDFNAPPKPPHRSVASERATLLKPSPSAYTALGRAITEIKARNTESPFPDREFGSRVGSRVGTPIDLGLTTANGSITVGNGGASMGNGYATPTKQTIRNEFDFAKDAKFYMEQSTPERTSQLPPPISGPPWRRVTTEATLLDTNSSSTKTKQNVFSLGYANNFASLRRGREYAVSDTETINRVRYYSASPKLPRVSSHCNTL
uniref:Uncharacterized protein n=1 Tax=Heterorhabditis bacteriophora TaxID=37862 RepID=A0A1I7XUE0_HETBA